MQQNLMIIDGRETLFKSIIKDIFTFSSIIFAFYINNHYLGNSLVLQIVLSICFFAVGIRHGSSRLKKVKTKQEAINFVNNVFGGEN